MQRPFSRVRRRIRRLRLAGVLVLVLGLGCAGLVWWLGSRQDGSSDEDPLIGDNKVATRQVEVLYGNQGMLIANWMDDLKRPGTQAFLIAAAAGLIAVGCFYVARWSEFDDEPR